MDLNDLMRGLGPLQQTMQKNDAERATARFEGSAGGGAVAVVLQGDLTVASVRIAPAAAAAAADDASLLEDLVKAACSDALRAYKVRYGATPEEQIQKLLAGSDLGAMVGPLLRGLGR
jgi:DNA-binding protein YbaB